jgi:hypothetical protein
MLNTQPATVVKSLESSQTHYIAEGRVARAASGVGTLRQMWQESPSGLTCRWHWVALRAAAEEGDAAA